MKNIIGKILKELLNKEGAPTKEDFSQMMGMSYKTLYNVINGSSKLTFEQVIKASDILNFNLIEEYHNRAGIETNFNSNNSSSSGERKITINLSISGSIHSFENFSHFLQGIRKNASDFGFEIN